MEVQDFVITCIKGKKTGWKSHQPWEKFLSLLKSVAELPLNSLRQSFHSMYLNNKKSITCVTNTAWIVKSRQIFTVCLSLHCLCCRFWSSSPQSKKVFTLGLCLHRQTYTRASMCLSASHWNFQLWNCLWDQHSKDDSAGVERQNVFSSIIFLWKLTPAWPRAWPDPEDYVNCTSPSRFCAKLFSQHSVYS